MKYPNRPVCTHWALHNDVNFIRNNYFANGGGSEVDYNLSVFSLTIKDGKLMYDIEMLDINITKRDICNFFIIYVSRNKIKPNLFDV